MYIYVYGWSQREVHYRQYVLYIIHNVPIECDVVAGGLQLLWVAVGVKLPGKSLWRQ